MPGRHRVPTEVHKLRGTFNATRHGKGRRGEPKPDGALGDPPDDLTPEQRAAWAEIAATAPLRVLTRHDRIVVEMAARLLAELRAMGDLTSTKWMRMESLLGRMGMTPADRSKVMAAGDDGPASPWDSLQVIDGGKKTG